jgi:hypothetical protein
MHAMQERLTALIVSASAGRAGSGRTLHPAQSLAQVLVRLRQRRPALAQPTRCALRQLRRRRRGRGGRRRRRQVALERAPAVEEAELRRGSMVFSPRTEDGLKRKVGESQSLLWFWA